jgi:hypothetical protein
MPDQHQLPLDGDQVTAALQKVHNADTVPTLSSDNMVTSDAVAVKIAELEARLDALEA